MKHFTSSPSQTILVDCSVALNRVEFVQPLVRVFAVFVRRLAVVASVQLHWGQADLPGHTFREGDWMYIRGGGALESGLYLSTPGAALGVAEIEVVLMDDGQGGPAIEYRR